MDAGVAEHRAGLPRREPEVQRLPRQLRQQVEAEGRLRARRPTSRPSRSCSCIAATSRRNATRSPGSSSRNCPVPRRLTSLADRRAAAAAIFTDPRIGRLPRTLVNRIWPRLLGHGIVANPDEMDGQPWSPELLDWLASDFVRSRLRRQAPDRDDPDLARVSDAGGGANRRSRPRAGTCSPAPKSAA